MTSMKKILIVSGLSVAALGMIAAPADARSHRRHTAGHSVRSQSRANAAAPGINPDGGKQTATGGQSGGGTGQE